MEENLVLTNYGVTLRGLTHDKIEMLRLWRNDPKISQYMFYREYITPEMQEKWFANLDKEKNYYFFIVIEDKPIGVVNLKDVDFEQKIGEPGIFIYEDEFMNGDVSFRSCLALMDFAFYTLGLKCLRGHIVPDNKRAVRFNKAFGYYVSNSETNEWSLDKARYEQQTQSIKQYLQKIY